MTKSIIRTCVGALALSLGCSLSTTVAAASIDKIEFEGLLAESSKRGAAPVVIHLAPLSLSEMSGDPSGSKVRMSQKAAVLLNELGQHAWPSARWENGVGQIGLYVTSTGLQILQASINAIQFTRDAPWHTKTRISGDDGSLAEIDRLLDQDGVVTAVVTANIDGLDFELRSDGTHAPSIPADRALHAREIVSELLKVAPGAKGQAPLSAEVEMTLSRQQVIEIASGGNARSLKPLNFRDIRPSNLEIEALQHATKFGSAEILISIRNPLASGGLSIRSKEAQTNALRRALKSVLARASITSEVSDLAVVGAVAGKFTLPELQRLFALRDPRILSININRVVGEAALATSTVAMNMTAAWNAGYKAAGQTIIVMDSGVQKSHAFFQSATGASRVTGEACFGTTGPDVDGTFYESRCPNRNALGDSPVGQPNSGSPIFPCYFGGAAIACGHGTHVAGIAAGRYTPLLGVTGLQGVAPDASIFSVQVFSYTSSSPPKAFIQDVVLALVTTSQLMTKGTTDNPATVNLSMSKPSEAVLSAQEQFLGSCPSMNPAFTAAVQELFDLGVPVVIATGNNSLDGKVAFPSCVPKSIKVAAVMNTLNANVRDPFSNMPNPINFPGEFVWLAAGGGQGVVSSYFDGTGGTTSKTTMMGTSQATPHISGLYAAIKSASKGITVDGASNWIRFNAAKRVTVPLCPLTKPCSNPVDVTFYGILLPAL